MSNRPKKNTRNSTRRARREHKAELRFDLESWRAECPDEFFEDTLAQVKEQLYDKLPHVPLRIIRPDLAYYEARITMLERTYPELPRIVSREPDSPEEQEYRLCKMFVPLLKFQIEQRTSHRKERATRTLPPLLTRKEANPPATGADAGEAKQPKPVVATPAAIPVSRTIGRGKFCEQVIDEIKRIKNLCVGSGRSVAEIQSEYPDFAVWKVRESLPPDDREMLNHPRQWGASVGYAKNILAKSEGVSEHTITASVKAYRKSQQPKKL